LKADTEEQRPRNTQVHIEVAIVGAVGALDSVGVSSSDGAADNHGKLILRSLEENEVDVSGVKIIQDEKTGFAHINVDYNDPNNTLALLRRTSNSP
jgi:sugar/nucleoside kinase (ribokinase family)